MPHGGREVVEHAIEVELDLAAVVVADHLHDQIGAGS